MDRLSKIQARHFEWFYPADVGKDIVKIIINKIAELANVIWDTTYLHFSDIFNLLNHYNMSTCI